MDEMERLAYQNRFVRQLVQDDLNYEASDATPQIISGPDNLILLKVSYEEWIKLTSSLFTGADICYPSESDNVRWILYRAVEQPMDLCALIAECIATSEATQEALRNFVLNDPAIQEYITQNISKGAPLLPEIEGQTIVENDDLDALFGAVTFLVDTIHDAIVDFNQDAEASTNSRELGAIIFESIPVLETLPFDQVSEYIDTLYNQIIEVFDSQWDTTPITGTRDRIRCALFCIARDNDNSLTWTLIQDYFYSLTGFTWSQTLNIMLEFANFVTTGTWSGEEVVDIAFGNFAAAMSGMGKFGEMLFPSLTALMALGQNNPDSDWLTLCEDCDTPPPTTNWQIVASPPYNNGTIVSETATTLVAEATANTDSIYRLVVQRIDSACVDPSAFSVSPGSAAYPAYRNCANTLIAAAITTSTNFRQISYASNVPFTVNVTFAVIP